MSIEAARKLPKDMPANQLIDLVQAKPDNLSLDQWLSSAMTVAPSEELTASQHMTQSTPTDDVIEEGFDGNKIIL
jgi:hypothetical protein